MVRCRVRRPGSALRSEPPCAFFATSIPEPLSELQHALPPSRAARRSRKPGQFTPGAIAGLGGARPNAAQIRFFDLLPDALATSMLHWRAITVKRISIGQASGTQASDGISLTHDLSRGQRATDQNGSCCVTKILRFVRPIRDEDSQVRSRRQPVFVEIEHWKTGRRIPPPTSTARETGVEGVLPSRVRDAPPYPAFWKGFAQKFHAWPWARSNENISRHAAKTLR